MQPVKPILLSIRGTITEPGETPQSPPRRVVYQRTAPGLGNLPGDPSHSLQRRRHVIPADPKTPAQLAQRARLAPAAAAWRALTPAERAAWAPAGAARGLTGYQAFVSNYLQG